MNILDENIVEDECELLRAQRVRVRHIGHDIGRKGIKDEEIIPFLHRLRRPTFFSRDRGFYDRRRGHARYCLVYLEIAPDQVAEFVRRVLRHPRLDTQAKRMGTVIRASSAGIRVLRRHGEEEALRWPESGSPH
jgi:hypothetical protein